MIKESYLILFVITGVSNQEELTESPDSQKEESTDGQDNVDIKPKAETKAAEENVEKEASSKEAVRFIFVEYYYY